MRFFTAIITAVALALPAFASPVAPLHDIDKFSGATTGKYIVKLKDSASKAAILAKINKASVTHDWGLINGFAGMLARSMTSPSPLRPAFHDFLLTNLVSREP